MATKKKSSKGVTRKSIPVKSTGKSANKKPALSAEEANTRAMETEIIKLMEEELCPSITIQVRFEMGLGRVKARLSRAGRVIDTQVAETSMDINFDTCCSSDVISLTGVCSAKAIITTDRKTNPLSDTEHPRVFEEQDILDILSIE
jgi:hypothetical protein